MSGDIARSIDTDGLVDVFAAHVLYGEDGDDQFACGCGAPVPIEVMDDGAELAWHHAHLAAVIHEAIVCMAASKVAAPVQTRVLLDAADAWRSEGRGVMFNRAGDDLTPEQRVGKWLRDRAARLGVHGPKERS